MVLNIVFYKKNWIKKYKNKSKPNDLVFFIGPCIFDEKKNIKNDSEELNNIAKEERKNFCDQIALLNKFFLEEKLIFEDLSLFFLSDLSVKRNEILETYDIFCIIKQLQKIIERENIYEINIFNCDPKFEKALKSILKLKKITIINYYKKNITRSIFLEFLSTTFFFFKCIFISIFNLKNKIKNKSENLFFSSYPLHFKDKKFFYEDKYKYLVKENDTFLLTLLTDGFHQNLNIFEFFKYKNKLKKINKYKVIVFENYLKTKDIVKTLIMSLKIFFSILRLKQRNYRFNQIDLTGYLNDELNISYSRILRNILFIKTLNNFFQCNSVENFNYYLHEYPIGRSISFVLKDKSIDNCFAYQHGPSSYRKLLYFLSTIENKLNTSDNLNNIPIPKNIYAEDNFSKKIYSISNYKNVRVLKQIPRLDYLKKIIVNKNNNTTLIVSGLHDGKFLINEIKKIIDASDEDAKFIFKPHPRSNINKISLVKSEKFSVSNEHISKLLSSVSKVICTYSSVAVEAKILGLEVELINIPGKINLSPLIDVEFLEILPELQKKLL